jgi:glycosidase
VAELRILLQTSLASAIRSTDFLRQISRERYLTFALFSERATLVWFQNSRSSLNSAYRDWYIWSDGKGPDQPPNNWVVSNFGLSAWKFDPATGQYYYHYFYPSSRT